MSSSGALSLLGWFILPNLVTGWVQTIYYSITIRAGSPKPLANTPKHALHRRRIHITVITVYLLYTLYEAAHNIKQTPNFYSLLNLPHTATDKEIKSRFRRLAALHHPDKIGAQNSSPTPEGYFMALKLAQDTLLEPVKRFAYDRFGPTILGWKNCSSFSDYVWAGAYEILPFYMASAAMVYILGLFGYMDWGKFWRWMTLGVLCTFELYTTTRPFHPLFLTKLVNPFLTTFTTHEAYLPFQAIEFARKISVTLFIAFSQIGPLLQGPSGEVASPQAKVSMDVQLDRLEAFGMALDAEGGRMMAMEMTPFMGDEGALRDVQGKLKDFLVQNTVRNDPEVRDAIGRVVQRRRTDAPAGAKGNR